LHQPPLPRSLHRCGSGGRHVATQHRGTAIRSRPQRRSQQVYDGCSTHVSCACLPVGKSTLRRQHTGRRGLRPQHVSPLCLPQRGAVDAHSTAGEGEQSQQQQPCAACSSHGDYRHSVDGDGVRARCNVSRAAVAAVDDACTARWARLRAGAARRRRDSRLLTGTRQWRDVSTSQRGWR